MASAKELVITLDGKRRVTAHVGAHAIHTDQPLDVGGEDSAPTPFELFLASIGACAGIFVQGFCAARQLDTSGIVLREWPRYDGKGTLVSVELAIALPPGFPARYRDALIKVVEQCSVKRAIAAQPHFVVRIAADSGSHALDEIDRERSHAH